MRIAGRSARERLADKNGWCGAALCGGTLPRPRARRRSGAVPRGAKPHRRSDQRQHGRRSLTTSCPGLSRASITSTVPRGMPGTSAGMTCDEGPVAAASAAIPTPTGRSHLPGRISPGVTAREQGNCWTRHLRRGGAAGEGGREAATPRDGPCDMVQSRHRGGEAAGRNRRHWALGGRNRLMQGANLTNITYHLKLGDKSRNSPSGNDSERSTDTNTPATRGDTLRANCSPPMASTVPTSVARTRTRSPGTRRRWRARSRWQSPGSRRRCWRSAIPGCWRAPGTCWAPPPLTPRG